MKTATFQKPDHNNQLKRPSRPRKNDDTAYVVTQRSAFENENGPSFNFGILKVHKSANGVIQPKLQINQPGDQNEQEADVMADKITRMSDKGTTQNADRNSASSIQSKYGECEIDDEEKKHQHNKVSDSLTSIAPPIVHEAISSSTGKPLDTATRSFMDSRFNYDFSNVKIHDDANAEKSANSINALAYTFGNNVFFNKGQYAPENEGGRKLLAHELTHVTQQDRGNSQRIQKFDSPEHVNIGDTAGQPISGLILLDSHKRDLPNRLRPVTQWPLEMQQLFNKGTGEQSRVLQHGLTYGEVLALSGDFYESFEDLNRAPLREIYDLIPLIRSHHATTQQLQQATGGRYLSLAMRNQAHFSTGPVNNMKVWRQRHIQAIVVAKSGNATMAYGINAAADHFLTDRFAAGHLLSKRNPNRSGIGKTAQALGSENELQALSAKIDHDIDNEHGANVENLRGDKWIAYGDEMWGSPLNQPNRKLTLEATESSANDIRQAIGQGQKYPTPDDTTVFNVEKIVPRVDTATSRQTHDEGARKKTYEKIASQTSLTAVFSDRFLNGDDLVRNWLKNINDAGIKTQPLVEKLRMVGELLSGNIDDADFDAFTRIYENSTDAEKSQIARIASNAGSTKVNVWLSIIH